MSSFNVEELQKLSPPTSPTKNEASRLLNLNIKTVRKKRLVHIRKTMTSLISHNQSSSYQPPSPTTPPHIRIAHLAGKIRILKNDSSLSEESQLLQIQKKSPKYLQLT